MKRNFLRVFICEFDEYKFVCDDQCMSSKWGDTDEIGNANLMNASSVLKASRLIKMARHTVSVLPSIVPLQHILLEV
ncbi:MAG: hypothetical protein CM15mP127_03220 [Gammaproteobacteria bacterium]|nr:MAG: hypothetical protein CM15mP127_03220 [Gammaproteobacteria bacterium]